MADVTVTGSVFNGSQQQFTNRNNKVGVNWYNGVWNFLFVGCENAPETHCDNQNGKIPATNVDATPTIAEKPYITFDGTTY